MAECDECREIAQEIRNYLREAKALLDQNRDERLSVVEALRRWTEDDARVVEEFFAHAPRLGAGAYPNYLHAMMRKVRHEHRTGHSVSLN